MLVLSTIQRPVSASELSTIHDCEARFFHERQKYSSGLLSTDRIAADVSMAFHDAAMDIHRRMERRLRVGQLPSDAEVRFRLREVFDDNLFKKGFRRSNPAVAERLGQMDAGIDRVADLILADAPGWASDPTHSVPLVWVEAALDHGPTIRAVEIVPGRLVSTRPDVIGLRKNRDGRYRAIVRDFKAKGQIVRPEADYGILVRGLWVLTEIQNPRCQWFIANRGIELDHSSITLETVNVMFSGDDESFIVRADLTAPDLEEARDRVLTTLDRADNILAATCADDVEASPGNLCLKWCPFLNRCEAGQDHVRRYSGEDELNARLGTD
jgi:hypothetical protein